MIKQLLIIRGDDRKPLCYLKKEDVRFGCYKRWCTITPGKVVKPRESINADLLGWVIAHNTGFLSHSPNQKRIMIFKYVAHAQTRIEQHRRKYNSLKGPRLMALVRDARQVEYWRKE